MANFKTHVALSAIASTSAAVIIANAGAIEVFEVPWYGFLGLIGGLLPDIDAANSKPAKHLFIALAALTGTELWLTFENRLPHPQPILLSLLAFLAVRYPLHFLFQKFTVHRGVIHSCLAALFFGLLATCISHRYLHWSILQAWFNGLFVAFGFILHLCLDELSSVDLCNSRMKKSFGTALKLFNYNDIPASLLLLSLVIALLIISPPSEPFFKAWLQADWLHADAVDGRIARTIRQAIL